MNMVPSQNISKQHYYHLRKTGGYVGCGLMSGVEGYDCQSNFLGSDQYYHMAHEAEADQEDSRTNSLSYNEEAAAVGSTTSKDICEEEEREEDQGNWLQLSLGSSSSNSKRDRAGVQRTTSRASLGLVELDLLPPGGGGGSSSSSRLDQQEHEHEQTTSCLAPSLIFHVPGIRGPRGMATNCNTMSFLYNENQIGSSSSNWAQRPSLSMSSSINVGRAATCTSSSSSFIQMGSYFSGPLIQIQAPASQIPDFRIIDPPRRPHSGIWFTLQASEYQAKEPLLPQISKSHLRIKDGRMTVRLLIKYLVNKLRLDNESEVEITCRGQHLLPFFTLQHIRDNIWSSREAVTLHQDSSTKDHLMILNYGRSNASK